MMDDPRPILSVIVPVYNTERYLERALNSILASTLKAVELILVDDGSTDGSPAICDRYQAEHPEWDIKVFHTENHGLSAVRNFGISRAAGKYVICCDSDDWVEPELFEKLTAAAESSGAQAAICGVNYYDESTGKIEHFKDSLFPTRLAGKVFDFRSCGAVIRGLLDCPTWNKVMLKSFIEKNHFRYDEDCDFGEDSRFWAEFFLTADHLVLVPKDLYTYRINQTRPTNCVKAKKEYASFAETLECVRGSMVRCDLFAELAGEFIAYMTMQFTVAYCAISPRRRGDFYRECAQVAKAGGGYRPSRELGFGSRCGVAYIYRILRYLPYWCGSPALLPLVVLNMPGVKKIIRKLVVKN